jgi:hypothetical protein
LIFDIAPLLKVTVTVTRPQILPPWFASYEAPVNVPLNPALAGGVVFVGVGVGVGVCVAVFVGVGVGVDVWVGVGVAVLVGVGV